MSTPSASLPAKRQLPRLAVSDGTLEALKWLGVLLMTGDHVNKYLLAESVPLLYAAGRLAMPIFGFVLACNLARPGARERGAFRRTMQRLAIAGALATPPFLALGGLLAGVYPLNILFMLLVTAATMFCIERKHRTAAVAVFLVGGAWVEFWWPAVGFCVAVWCYAKRPGVPALLLAIVSCALLGLVNGNAWALAALPLLGLATRLDLAVVRIRWAFYVFYPAHLCVLWLLKAGT